MNEIRERRERLGLTQVALATQAGIALPTLQQLECGNSNPSLQTLQQLGKVLGFTVEFSPSLPNWDLLQQLGLPHLSGSPSTKSTGKKRGPKILFNRRELLVNQLRLAIESVSLTEGEDRLRDAVASLLIAIRDHYPDFFKGHFQKNKKAALILSQELTGKKIKLRRIALSYIAEYL